MWLMLEGDAEILVRCPPCPPPPALYKCTLILQGFLSFLKQMLGEKRESH